MNKKNALLNLNILLILQAWLKKLQDLQDRAGYEGWKQDIATNLARRSR